MEAIPAIPLHGVLVIAVCAALAVPEQEEVLAVTVYQYWTEALNPVIDAVVPA